MPRVDDIFRSGNSYLNMLSLAENRVRYLQFALLNSDAFTVMIFL